MLQKRFAPAHTILNNRDGNIAITFALSLLALMTGVGMSVDYAKSYGEKSKMQQALDATVLALASRGGTIDQQYAESLFYSNFNMKPGQGNWTTISDLNFEIAEDGTYVAHASGSVATSIMAITGVTQVAIAGHSEAVAPTITKLETATFKIDNAKGAFDKDIYFYTRDANGKIISEELILQYDYSNKWGGTKTLTPPVTDATTVNVADYASFGYKMVVYEDTSYTGKHINPKSYYSDDVNAKSFTKEVGNCSDAGGSKNYWEDGGDADFLDFVFKLSCTEKTVASGNVRLTN